MAYITILIIAIALTILAFWRINALLSIVAMSAWFGMLAYHLGYPPANVVAGTATDNFILLAYVGMALAMAFMGWSRTQTYGWNIRGEIKTKEDVISRERKDPMDISEYRASIRRTRGR